MWYGVLVALYACIGTAMFEDLMMSFYWEKDGYPNEFGIPQP